MSSRLRPRIVQIAPEADRPSVLRLLLSAVVGLSMGLAIALSLRPWEPASRPSSQPPPPPEPPAEQAPAAVAAPAIAPREPVPEAVREPVTEDPALREAEGGAAEMAYVVGHPGPRPEVTPGEVDARVAGELMGSSEPQTLAATEPDREALDARRAPDADVPAVQRPTPAPAAETAATVGSDRPQAPPSTPASASRAPASRVQSERTAADPAGPQKQADRGRTAGGGPDAGSQPTATAGDPKPRPRRFARGYVAYLHCSGLRPQGQRCPRDRLMERRVWAALRSLKACPVPGLRRGRGEVRLTFKRRHPPEIEYRTLPNGPAAAAVEQCAAEKLQHVTSRFSPIHMIVLFRFELR